MFFKHYQQMFEWVVKAGNIAHFIEGEVINPKWERKIIGIANL